MKKIVWVCGLIAGVITSSWTIYSMIVPPKTMNWDMGMIYGYTTMLLAFSLIFVGIRNYRDKRRGGVISFGRAFLVGLYITLIASTVYVVLWIINFRNFNPDFMDMYALHQAEEMREKGISEIEIMANGLEMREFMNMYKNNVFFAAVITYLEILPIGIIVSLVAALILRRKRSAGHAQTPAEV